MSDNRTKFTRGNGLFEGFLAKKRAYKASELIAFELRTGRLLDIGCGSYPFFLLNVDFKEKYGIDPSLTLQKTIKNIHLSKIRIGHKKIPFKNDFFEVVTMLAVFEHIDNQDLVLVLKEIKRILKRNGRLIITTPSPWADKLLHFMAKFSLISKEEIHEHKHHYNRDAIIKMMIGAGFKKENMTSGFFEMGLNMWFSVKK